MLLPGPGLLFWLLRMRGVRQRVPLQQYLYQFLDVLRQQPLCDQVRRMLRERSRVQCAQHSDRSEVSGRHVLPVLAFLPLRLSRPLAMVLPAGVLLAATVAVSRNDPGAMLLLGVVAFGAMAAASSVGGT